MSKILHPVDVRKRTKIRNQYNQAPNLTHDTNGNVTTSQLDITNESQNVSLFQTGDHKCPKYIIECQKHPYFQKLNAQMPKNISLSVLKNIFDIYLKK